MARPRGRRQATWGWVSTRRHGRVECRAQSGGPIRSGPVRSVHAVHDQQAVAGAERATGGSCVVQVDEEQLEKLTGGPLHGVHSDRCTDALVWNTGNGARLGIWDCTPHHTNQQWQGPGLGT